MRSLRAGIVVLACSAMLAACQKEETGTMTTINIMAEDFHGGDSKMGAYISASRVNFTWETGDEVRINDGVFAVTRSNSNATISAPEGQPFTAPIRALSPASLYNGALTSDQVQVTLPDTYQWSTFTQRIGGQNTTCQKLNAPMAYYGDASNLNYSNDRQRIVFKNLCGALAVKITNTTGLPLDMEEIQVISNRYKLSGNLSINFTNLEGLQPVSTSTRNTVTMRFDNEDLTLQANESKVVLIPVLPVGDDNRFAIQVKYRNTGYSTMNTEKHCYTYSRTQPSGSNALARSQFGYAPISAVTSTGSGYSLSKDHFFTDADYFLIKDMWQLGKLGRVGDSYLGATKIKIIRDIDITPGTIGALMPMYYITEVDGGGHTITGAVIGVNTDNYAGLLRNPTDAVIKDLTLLNPQVRIYSNTSYAGCLIAKAEGTTTINNCHVDNPDFHNGTVSGSYTSDLAIGGLIGRSNGSLNIKGSAVINLKFSAASASSPNYFQVNCGGMVGYASLAASDIIDFGLLDTVVIAYQNTDPLVATQEVRFGGVIGMANGGQRWDVRVNIFVGYKHPEEDIPFVVKSTASDVYAGHILGRAANAPSDRALRPKSCNAYGERYPWGNRSPYWNTLEVYKPATKNAYIGADDVYVGNSLERVGHIVGNLDDLAYLTGHHQLFVTVVNI